MKVPDRRGQVWLDDYADTGNPKVLLVLAAPSVGRDYRDSWTYHPCMCLDGGSYGVPYVVAWPEVDGFPWDGNGKMWRIV